MMKLRKELIILGLTVIASLLAFAFDPFNLRGNHPNWSEGVYFTIFYVIRAWWRSRGKLAGRHSK